MHLCLQFEERGFYQYQHLDFIIELSDTYPYDPPFIRCETKVYHPMIGNDGFICLEQLAIHHQTYHRTPFPSYLQYEEPIDSTEQQQQPSFQSDETMITSEVHRCNMHNVNAYLIEENTNNNTNVNTSSSSKLNFASCNCVFMNYNIENVINCLINLFMDATYFTNYLTF
jgi:hypothetical protein